MSEKSGKSEEHTQKDNGGRGSRVPGCQDWDEGKGSVTDGWHSWGRPITLCLFELTKHPSLSLRRQKNNFTWLCLLSLHPFLAYPLVPQDTNSFIQPLLLVFCFPVTSLTLFKILFIRIFVPEQHWCAPGQSPAAVSRTMQRFINMSPFLGKNGAQGVKDIK